MPTPTKYTKSLAVDFSGKVIPSQLKKEIQDHANIYHAVDTMAISGDVVDIWFKDAIDAVEVLALDAVIAAHAGVKVETIPKVEISNHIKAEAVPTQGTRTNFVTHNFCDKTTWYTDSARIEEEILTETSGTEFACIHTPVVDVSHGKVFSEHDRVDALGNSYKLVCTVDGAPVTEKDKHTNIGDYVFDYNTGVLTFDTSKTGQQVKLTYYKVQSSRFSIQAAAGKKLTVSEVENQFSADYNITDTIIFQPRAPVQLVAPHLAVSNGGPVPDGTLIDLASPTVYNTDRDLLRESNGAFPTVTKSTNPAAAANWRMGGQDMLGYPWAYKAAIELLSSLQMQIDIYLEHDTPFGGLESTATLYCLSEDEE